MPSRSPFGRILLVEGRSPAELDFTRLVEGVDPHAIPGVQRKASASMISVPLSAEYGRFILKLSQSEYPHLIENEAAHLQAAQLLKIPVTDATLVADRNMSSPHWRASPMHRWWRFGMPICSSSLPG